MSRWFFVLISYFRFLTLALKVLGGRHEGSALVNDPLAHGQVFLDVGANILVIDLGRGDARNEEAKRLISFLQQTSFSFSKDASSRDGPCSSTSPPIPLPRDTGRREA